MAIKPSRKAREKYSSRYWADQITQRLDDHKKFWEAAKQSIDVYNTTHKIDDVERRMNCWWSLVNTMLPAYYSSTPKAEVSLKKKAGSSLYTLAGTILERNVQHEMDDGFDFDQVGLDSALQYLLTGIGVLWARYEPNISTKSVKIGLIKSATGQILDASGKPYEGKEEPQEGEHGLFIERECECKEDEGAVLDVVNYDDYLVSDARNQGEIEWRARRAWLSEEEALETFGADIADELSFDSFPENIAKNRDKRDKMDGKAELWEIYCEEAGKVFWCQVKGSDSILQSGEPPIEFEGFYPCVEIRSYTDPLSVIPRSDYEHVKDQILEVERLTTRIAAVTQAIRTNFAYDSTLKELEDFMTGDLKGVPVVNWPSYKGRGGLANSMEFMNVQPYVQALEVLQNAREVAWNKLCESLKCSDLLRGQTDPTKTATANRLENAWSSLGLIVRQNQFANFIGGAIGKLGTIIAQQFSPEHLLMAADADDLINPISNGDPMQAAQIKQDVLAIIKNESEMCYRIQIASDSMVALNERQERQDAADLIQSAGAFFQQMQQMIEQYPPLSTFGMQLFQYVIRRYRGGKELEPIFMDALTKMTQIAQQKQDAAAQQPPDPKIIEQQTRMQIAQMESQDAHQKNMLEAQALQTKSQLEMQAQQFEQFMKGKELELKAQEVNIALMTAQADIADKATRAGLEDKKLTTEATLSALQMHIDKQMSQVDAMIKQQEANTKELASKLHAWEKINEERRLAQVELGTKEKLPIQIINQLPETKPTQRIVRKLSDAKGEFYKSEDVPSEG